MRAFLGLAMIGAVLSGCAVAPVAVRPAPRSDGGGGWYCVGQGEYGPCFSSRSECEEIDLEVFTDEGEEPSGCRSVSEAYCYPKDGGEKCYPTSRGCRHMARGRASCIPRR